MAFPKVIPLLALLSLAACVSLDGRYTVVATKGGTDAFLATAPERVKGEACKRSILFFIPLTRVDRPEEEAINNALESAKGAQFLTDVKVSHESLFTVFYNYRCTQVEGTPSSLKK